MKPSNDNDDVDAIVTHYEARFLLLLHEFRAELRAVMQRPKRARVIVCPLPEATDPVPDEVTRQKAHNLLHGRKKP